MKQLNFSFKTRWLLLPLMLLTLSVGSAWGAVNGNVFERVSAVNDLSDGDEIIFVNQAETYACGTTQNTNNRTPVSISVSNHKYTYNSSHNVQVFVVKKNSSGKYGFHTGTGYLYSKSSSRNQTYTNTTAASTAPSGTEAWSLSVSSYVFTITNVTNTSYYLAFNGTDYFTQYSSGYIKPYIFKKQVASGYSITYHCNGATDDCPSNASGQTKLPATLPTPTRTGCTFAGWYTNEGLTSAAEEGTTLSANIDLYAKWTCNVTLNRNGVADNSHTNVAVGTTLASLQGEGNQGGCTAWTFLGWSKTQRAAQNVSTEMTLVTEVDGPGPYYAVYSHTESGGTTDLSKTETFENQSESTTYNSTQNYNANSSNAGIAWTMYYGTVSTNAVLTDSKSAQMRWYSSAKSNIPYIATTTPISGLQTLTFNAAVGNTNIKMKVEKSTDGSTWTAVATNITMTTSKDDYSVDINGTIGTNYYIKIGVDGGNSTAPSSGNYTFRVDDVKFDYTASGGSTTYYSTTASCCTPLGTIKGSFF